MSDTTDTTAWRPIAVGDKVYVTVWGYPYPAGVVEEIEEREAIDSASGYPAGYTETWARCSEGGWAKTTQLTR